MKATTRRSDDTARLNEFVNALRACLGLGPLNEETNPDDFTVEEWEARRFFVPPYSTRSAMTPRRGGW